MVAITPSDDSFSWFVLSVLRQQRDGLFPFVCCVFDVKMFRFFGDGVTKIFVFWLDWLVIDSSGFKYWDFLFAGIGRL